MSEGGASDGRNERQRLGSARNGVAQANPVSSVRPARTYAWCLICFQCATAQLQMVLRACRAEAGDQRIDRLNLYRCPQRSEGMKDNETKTRFMELRAQGLPLKKIAAEIKVSKTTLINWDRDFKGEIDNLRAVELEAMYDKYDLSTRKKVEFFGDILSRIQRELETRDLSSISTEKLFVMYAHFYREAKHTLPEIAFRDEDEIKAVKAQRDELNHLLSESNKRICE